MGTDGFMQGFNLVQNQRMRQQEFELQKAHAEAQLKSMQTQEEMAQLQLGELAGKLAFQERFQSQLEGVMGPQGAPLGPMDQGPVLEPQPELDRRKLTSLLMTAQQHGQDPVQLLQLMSLGDPRIKAIADTLTPKKFEKVGEGEQLVNPQTGEVISRGSEKGHVLPAGSTFYRPGQEPVQAPAKPEVQKPVVAAPGSTILMPDGSQIQVPTGPQKPVAVGEGQQLVDPQTGKVIHEGKPKQEKPVVVGQGQSMVDPTTGKELFKAPDAPVKPVAVAPGGTLVNPQTGEQVFTAPLAAKPIDYGDRTESAAAVYLSTVMGVTEFPGGAFDTLLRMDPIAAKKVRDQAMVDEPTTIQAGKLAAATKQDEEKLLNPEEANKLGVPYGTKKGEAKGLLPMTQQQRESLAGFDSARVMIQDIRQYSEKVNKAAGGLKGRAQQAQKLWGAWTQSDTDAAMLQSKGGELARLARSMGEKGAMAEGDIARAAALVPSILDTRDVAVKKLQDLTVIIEEAEANFRKSLGMQPVSKAKATTPAPVKPKVEDPYAYIQVPPGLNKQQAEAYKKAYHDERLRKQQQMRPQNAQPNR